MTVEPRVGAGVLLALLLVTSGCVGFLTGQEPFEAEAAPATVAGGTLSETGYERTNASELTLNRTVEAGGQSRKVVVTNHVTQYGRSVDLGVVERDASVFVLLATPRVELLGRSFNPIGDVSNRRLLGRTLSGYGQIDVGTAVGNTTVTALGTETTVEKFSGTTPIGGAEIDVYIHVARVEHGDDFVVAIGIYPQRLPDEEGRVLSLIRNIRHES